MSCNNQTVFTFGVCEKADETVITASEILEIDLVSTVPSGNITDKVGLFVVGKSVEAESSTVICVVVAAAILPPLLKPERTGSAISITEPGLTIIPESTEVANETTSDSFCSANKIALANLLA